MLARALVVTALSGCTVGGALKPAAVSGVVSAGGLVFAVSDPHPDTTCACPNTRETIGFGLFLGGGGVAVVGLGTALVLKLVENAGPGSRTADD